MMKFTSKFVLVTVLGIVAGCGSVPTSVRDYAKALPARADGQYALLDDPIRKQLVLMDALLQCKIDVEDQKKEDESGACKCNKSTAADWHADCQAWLNGTPPVAVNANATDHSNSGSN